DAVTVAEEMNAVTVFLMSFEITETPVEIPANPATTATPTTVAAMVEVSSALTVTAVPALIVPPVTEASTWTAVVFVPMAAAAAREVRRERDAEAAGGRRRCRDDVRRLRRFHLDLAGERGHVGGPGRTAHGVLERVVRLRERDRERRRRPEADRDRHRGRGRV